MSICGGEAPAFAFEAYGDQRGEVYVGVNRRQQGEERERQEHEKGAGEDPAEPVERPLHPHPLLAYANPNRLLAQPIGPPNPDTFEDHLRSVRWRGILKQVALGVHSQPLRGMRATSDLWRGQREPRLPREALLGPSARSRPHGVHAATPICR